MSVSSLSFASMSDQALIDLQNHIQKEQVLRQDRPQIPRQFGEWFSSIVGIDLLCRLPKNPNVDALLSRVEKYASDTITPSMLRDESAIRGLMSFNRYFVAIKIEARENNEARTILGVFVEVIHARRPLEVVKDWMAPQEPVDNYVAALQILNDYYSSRASFLYSHGGMSSEQVEAVQKLLAGEEIEAPVAPIGGPRPLIRMVVPSLVAS